MDRVQRLRRFWSWLPVFRAVAESEHLPSAAKELHLSVSALSRTIGLLEDDIGRPLFRRIGRRIELNDDGRTFLRVVRDAMRLVDDGLSAIESDTIRGPIYVAAPPMIGHACVFPALETMLDDHPRITPHLVPVDERRAAEAVRKGKLDLAFVHRVFDAHDLLVEHLLDLEVGVYCGAAHVLATEESLDLETVLATPFVVPSTQATDGWPPEYERTVGAVLDLAPAVLEACARGRYLAALPVVVAARYQGPSRLHRLDVDPVPPMPLYALCRPHLRDGNRSELFLAEVRRTLDGILAHLDTEGSLPVEGRG